MSIACSGDRSAFLFVVQLRTSLLLDERFPAGDDPLGSVVLPARRSDAFPPGKHMTEPAGAFVGQISAKRSSWWSSVKRMNAPIIRQRITSRLFSTRTEGFVILFSWAWMYSRKKR